MDRAEERRHLRDRVQSRERGSIGAQVVYTIGPSYGDINRIWIGTDDGVIATTADGGLALDQRHAAGVTDFMKVFTIDPGRFDALTAYAAVNTLRLDDMNPHIYRTHDGGRTWKEIVDGIPAGAPVSVVREDPKRKGLLFAGSETQVYVSFDDGDHWQSLRLNMAASSVRDLVIKDDDLVVGTHGRGIWILDDITPLRQIDADNGAAGGRALQAADRVARPVEHEHRHAAAARRADGAESARRRDRQLLPEVRGGGSRDARDTERDGKVVRRYSSDDEVFRPDPATTTMPLYWFRPPMTLSQRAGHASLHVGRALSADRRREPSWRADAAHCRGRAQHRAGADDAVGESRLSTP